MFQLRLLKWRLHKNGKLCQGVEEKPKQNEERWNKIVFFENANLFFQMFFFSYARLILNFIIVANDYFKYFNSIIFKWINMERVWGSDINVLKSSFWIELNWQKVQQNYYYFLTIHHFWLVSEDDFWPSSQCQTNVLKAPWACVCSINRDLPSTRLNFSRFHFD